MTRRGGGGKFFMDRKTLEEFIRMYPDIDKEIRRIEDEVERLQKVIQDYQSFDNSKLPDVVHVIESVVDAANEALKYQKERLIQLHEAKIKFEKALAKLTPEQRAVIELRYWNGQYRPTRWKEVAKYLNYHVKSVERIYKGVIDFIMAS